MYEATADRDHLVELIRKYSGVFQDEAEAARLEELEIGVPIERITTVVDVRAFVGAKRAAMREHASQIGGPRGSSRCPTTCSSPRSDTSGTSVRTAARTTTPGCSPRSAGSSVLD